MSSMHSGAMLLVSFCYSSIDQLVFDGFPNALSANLSVVIFIIFIAYINHHWNIGRSMRNKNINIQKSYHKPLNIRYTTSHACSDFWDIYPWPLHCVFHQSPPRKVLLTTRFNNGINESKSASNGDLRLKLRHLKLNWHSKSKACGPTCSILELMNCQGSGAPCLISAELEYICEPTNYDLQDASCTYSPSGIPRKKY